MIEKIIADHLGLDLSEVTDDKHIIDDLGADSLQCRINNATRRTV